MYDCVMKRFKLTNLTSNSLCYCTLYKHWCLHLLTKAVLTKKVYEQSHTCIVLPSVIILEL